MIWVARVESSSTVFLPWSRSVFVMPFLSILIFLLLPLSILLILFPILFSVLLPTLSSLTLLAPFLFIVKTWFWLIIFPFLALVPVFPSAILWPRRVWGVAVLFLPLPFTFFLLSLLIMLSLSFIFASLSIIFSITIYFYLLRGVERRPISLFLWFPVCFRFKVILYLQKIRRWADDLGDWLLVFRVVIDCLFFQLFLTSFWHNTVYYLRNCPFADSAHFEELLAHYEELWANYVQVGWLQLDSERSNLEQFAC